MILGFARFIEFVTDNWPWGILVILIGIIYYLLRIILDEDRSGAWRARIYKAIFKISGKSEAEKKYIENDICSRINLARRGMPFGKEYLPKSIAIEWLEGRTGETVNIKENEIVVRLDPAESQEKNVVLLASALVKQTSLVGIRHILKESLELSIDLNIVKNLLKQSRDKRILDWFFCNEYQPNIDKSGDIKEWNGKIVEIDERGLFTRLLLVELDEYSKSISARSSSPEMFDEIVGLVNFLFKIATKAYGQEVPLDYVSRNIKIGVILVGDTSKILYDGVEPYLRAFAHTMRRQLASIYVIQFDKELLGVTDPQAYEEFVELTKGLERKIEEIFRIKKDFELKYTCTDSLGKKRKAGISHYIPEYLP